MTLPALLVGFRGQGSRRHAKVDVVTVAIGGGLGANAAAPAREDEVHG